VLKILLRMGDTQDIPSQSFLTKKPYGNTGDVQERELHREGEIYRDIREREIYRRQSSIKSFL
jgi:hypothetical protein